MLLPVPRTQSERPAGPSGGHCLPVRPGRCPRHRQDRIVQCCSVAAVLPGYCCGRYWISVRLTAAAPPASARARGPVPLAAGFSITSRVMVSVSRNWKYGALPKEGSTMASSPFSPADMHGFIGFSSLEWLPDCGRSCWSLLPEIPVAVKMIQASDGSSCSVGGLMAVTSEKPLSSESPSLQRLLN